MYGSLRFGLRRTTKSAFLRGMDYVLSLAAEWYLVSELVTAFAVDSCELSNPLRFYHAPAYAVLSSFPEVPYSISRSVGGSKGSKDILAVYQSCQHS